MQNLLYIAIGLLLIFVVAKLFFKSFGCLIRAALILAVLFAILWLLRAVFHLF